MYLWKINENKNLKTSKYKNKNWCITVIVTNFNLSKLSMKNANISMLIAAFWSTDNKESNDKVLRR